MEGSGNAPLRRGEDDVWTPGGERVRGVDVFQSCLFNREG